MVAGRHVGGAALVGGLFLPGSPTYAQEPATNVPTTRAEAIAVTRVRMEPTVYDSSLPLTSPFQGSA